MDKDLKIKVWGLVAVNKKQFFVVYITLSIIFVGLASICFIFNKTDRIYFSWNMPFLSTTMGFFWLFMFLSAVMEGQFYWNKFVKKQLEIIEEQRNQIAEKNKELNLQDEEIKVQLENLSQANEKITLQKTIIGKHLLQTTESINYAKKIQKVVLQIDNFLDKNNYFILFKPRDIVSGDFFYIKQLGNKQIIAAADCTGHGVPGAFLSMLGVSFLNEILSNKITTASEILEILRTKIKKSLHQTEGEHVQKDGMDIALYIVDTEILELQFSGAYNPLYIIRNEELGLKNTEQKNKNIRISNLQNLEITNNKKILIELKANRQPVAVYIKEKKFNNVEIQLNKNDCIYSFSDGFQDQFGGENSTKFMTKNFKKLLLKISDKSMQEQKEILNQTFENWRGNLEQTDDVVVVGLKI